MLKVFPYLEQVKIDPAWGGPMAFSANLWAPMPLVGRYKPKQSGGTQVGNSRTNLYGQVLVAWAF